MQFGLKSSYKMFPFDNNYFFLLINGKTRSGRQWIYPVYTELIAKEIILKVILKKSRFRTFNFFEYLIQRQKEGKRERERKREGEREKEGGERQTMQSKKIS